MAFNINAQVILSGPKNIKAVTNSIKQQLGNLSVNVNVNVPKKGQTQLTNLNNQLNLTNKNYQNLVKTQANASNALNKTAQSSKTAANAMQVLGKETALTFKRFAAAGIVTATFFRLSNAIAEAVPKALEFERELTKISQVTGGTTAGLNKLSDAASNLAKNLGLDANEILSVARIFAQTGQTLDQVEASMKAVARASLAPSFGEMSNTAEGLIASLNQFNIAASESEAVLASINAVSKKFAVESEDVISAIRRVGGVFATAANDAEKPQEALNQLIAIFTSVRSTTRESAETIATGLRTIFSRIQRPQTIEFLKQLGINLKDADGNFVGLFSSFRILSKELDEIIKRGDTLALSKVVEELGGIRQVGKLIPAIKEFRKAESAFAIAQQGAVEGLGGDVAKGLQPLIKTFEQIQSRFEALIRTISESATFQTLAKIVAGMANAFLGLAEALVPVLPALTAFAAVKISKGVGDFARGFFGSAKAGGGLGGAGAALGNAATGSGGQAQVTSQNALASAVQANTQQLSNFNQNSTNLANALKAIPLSANTQATNNLTTAVNRLIPALSTLNVGFGRGPGGARGGGGGRRPRGFASGGLVPGTGNRDTVPAMLTPGEFVIRKSAVGAFGAGNLSGINKYANGGDVEDEPQKASITTSGELAAIFMGMGDGPKGLGSQSINKPSLTNKKGPVFDIAKSIFPELADFREGTDTITANLGTYRSVMDDTASTSLMKEVKKTVGKAVEDVSSALADSFDVEGLTDVDRELAVEKALGEIDFNSMAGHFFEGVVAGTTGAKLTESGATFDFADLTSDVIERMNLFFDPALPLDTKLLEAKKSLSKDNIASNQGGSLLRKILASADLGDPFGLSVTKMAKGGTATGTDTVPALLTPGEFVVNKRSAQSFGYGNLNNINKYAQGGVVRAGRNNYGTPSARTKVSGNTGATINPKPTQQALNNVADGAKGVSGAFNEIGNSAAGMIAVFSMLPGIVEATANSLDRIASGEATAGDWLSVVTNVALLGSSLKGAASGLKGFGKKLSQQKTAFSAGATTQRNLLSTKKGVNVPGSQGMQSRSFAQSQINSSFSSRFGAASERAGGGFKGAVSAARDRVSSGIRSASNRVGLGITKGSQAASGALTKVGRAGAAGAVRTGGASLAKNAVKGLKGGGLVAAVASIVAGPIIDSITSGIGGTKEEIVPGVTGRREGVGAGRAGDVGGAMAKGAIEGAAIGSFVPVIGTALGAAVGAIGAGIEEFFAGAAKQAEFEAIVALGDAAEEASTELDSLTKASLLSSSNLASANAKTTAVFGKFDAAVEQSLQTQLDVDMAGMLNPLNLVSGAFSALFSPIDTVGNLFSGVGKGIEVASNGLANLAEQATGIDFGSLRGFFDSTAPGQLGMSEEEKETNKKRRKAETREAISGDDEREAITKALQGLPEEFAATARAAFENVAKLATTELANIDLDALRNIGEAGLSLETAADGAISFSGDAGSMVTALQAAGEKIGEGSELVTQYSNVVRASSMEIAKQQISDAQAAVQAAKDAGGEGWFWDSDALNEAEGALKASQNAGRAIAELGDSIGEASPEEINDAIAAVGITSAEEANKVRQLVQEQQAAAAQTLRVAAANAELEKIARETAFQIEALGEGLLKLDNITAQAANRFAEFADSFATDFDRAFGSDAILALGPQINPFENLDTSTPDEIAAGLENIKAAIGDVAGGPNEGATKGFQDTLKSTQELPFAIKGAMQDLVGAEGGREFASAQDASSAILKQLEARGTAPEGAARDILVKNIEAQFNKRQTEAGGGAIKITSDLVTGVASQIGEMGKKLQDALASTAESLNVYRQAQLQLAQFEIELINKRKETANKLLDIDQRRAQFLGRDEGKDPRDVANRDLSARLAAAQTGIEGVGLSAVTSPGGSIGVSQLQSNRNILQDRRAELQKQVDETAGPVDQGVIDELAKVEAALAGTKQSLDILADDTTKLAAIQKNIEGIEKRKMSAQDRLLTLQGELAAAMESGDLQKVAELRAEIDAPRAALAKAQAGESLTLQESNALAQGRDQLVAEGLITPEQAATLGNSIAGGFLASAGGILGGPTTINGGAAMDFLSGETSLGGGAMVGVDTAEQAEQRAQGEEIIQEQEAIAAEKLKNAEAQMLPVRQKLTEEAERAKQSFLDAGDALQRLRFESEALSGKPSEVAGAANNAGGAGGMGSSPQEVSQADQIRNQMQNIQSTAMANVSANDPTTQAMTDALNNLASRIGSLESNGIQGTINGQQSVTLTNPATIGREFEQLAELGAIREIASQEPQLQQRFQQAVSSQMNAAT